MATNKGGRPTIYTQDIADIICEGIARGISLVRICDSDDSLPAPRAVYRWLRKYPEFRRNYEFSKEDQADAMVEEMLDIADDGSNDWMMKHKGDDVGYAANGEHIQRSRLRVDTRKWAASKFKCKRYGDKTAVDLNAAISLTDLSDEELASRILQLQQIAKKA